MTSNILLNTFIVKTVFGLYKKRCAQTFSQCIHRNMASAAFFKGKGDRFRGVTVISNLEHCDCVDFPKKLEESLNHWREDNKRTIWFKVHLDQSEWIPPLTKKGFKYHHAKEDYVMMYLWLPKDETNNIPCYAHTLVGVGGLVINDKSQVLVVREKYAIRTFWKLPGGYVEPGENFIDAGIREVMEETNISTEFQSVIGFRHTHDRIFDCSDIYVIVSLKPTSAEITKEDQEISECIWMDVQEYLSHPEIHALNKMLVEKYLEYQEKNIRIDCISGIHPTLKQPFTFFSVDPSNIQKVTKKS